MSSVKSAPQLSLMTKKHGEFQLELDDDDTQAPEMPSLIQHDLDEILNQPIELPKTRWVENENFVQWYVGDKVNYGILVWIRFCSFKIWLTLLCFNFIRMRPPSPSMKLLSGSNDAKSAINLVISQVASNDVTSSIQALAQVSTWCVFFFQKFVFCNKARFY